MRLDSISTRSNKAQSSLRSDTMTSLVHQREREIMVVAAEIGLDGSKGLFDGHEVGWIWWEVNKPAESLVLDQVTDSFSMMDTTVIENKDASGSRIRVGER
jgi:hypothetical protein